MDLEPGVQVLPQGRPNCGLVSCRRTPRNGRSRCLYEHPGALSLAPSCHPGLMGRPVGNELSTEPPNPRTPGPLGSAVIGNLCVSAAQLSPWRSANTCVHTL